MDIVTAKYANCAAIFNDIKGKKPTEKNSWREISSNTIRSTFSDEGMREFSCKTSIKLNWCHGVKSLCIKLLMYPMKNGFMLL